MQEDRYSTGIVHIEEQITGPLSWWIGLTDIIQEEVGIQGQFI
jgi:hypothetical protein